MADEQINIEFILNSPQLLEEYNKLITSGKSVDDSVAAINKRYQEMTAAQALGAKGAGDLVETIKNVGTSLTGANSVEELHTVLINRDSASTRALILVKNLWVAVNARLSASLVALGLSATAANIAAQALMATITLGLSIAVAAIVVKFNEWQEEQEKIAAEQKKLAEAVADSAASMITSYYRLQNQWNALANDLKAKQKFINGNQQEFHKLGVEVNGVNDAEKLFKDGTDTFIQALMARAEAAAAAQLAVESFKESLLKQSEASESLNNPTRGDGIKYWFNSTFLGKSVEDEVKDAYKESQEARDKAMGFITKEADAQKRYDELIEKMGLKRWLGKEKKAPKEKKPKKLAEVFDEGSLLKLQQEIMLLDGALQRMGKNGEVRLRAVDKYGKEYATKEVVSYQQAYDARSKLKEQYDELEKKINFKNTEDEIAYRQQAWENYYKYESEYGVQAAKEQFSGIKAEADSFYDWLTQNKMKLDSIVESGGTLSAKQKADLELYTKKIAEIRGDKTEKDNFSTMLNLQLEKVPLLVDKIELLKKKISELDNDKGVDSGKYSIVSNLLADYENQLSSMTTEFINSFQNVEIQKTAIVKKYAAIRAGIEKRKLSPEETKRLLAELEREKQGEIDTVLSAEYAKSSIYERFSQNLLGITKRELAIRIASLEEYIKLAKNNLNTEQQKFIATEIGRAKAIKSTFNIGVEEKALLQQKDVLIRRIQDKQKKGIADVQDESNKLEIVNGKLKDIQAKRAQMAANIAGAMASGFKAIAGSIDDTNEGLADTLNTLGGIMGIAQNAAGAFASFASGDIVGGISQAFNAVAGIFSLGKAARESERKAREEIKKYNDSVFQSGLDYNEMLRKRIMDELKLNDVYKARIQNIKDEMAANTKNKESIIRDQEAVLKRLLNADTVVGMHTEKYGGFLGIGRKTRAVEDMAKVGDLLGLKGYKIDPFKGMSEFMKKFFGIKSPVNNDITETIGLTDELFDRLAKLNAEKPLTGDAKAAYEQLLKLREEYGSIEQMNRELEKQYKDTITGVTAQNIGDSIREGILSGKKSFADFADDIEDILRKGIIAGMEAKVIEPQMQKLQDALAEYLGDGVLTDDERKQFQEMYMKVAKEAKDYMDLINQSGINIGDSIGGANSLQGAYKAASQESIDLLSGNTAGMRLAILEGNGIMKSGFAAMMEVASRQLAVQMDIEKNTRRTADNTEKLHDIDEGIDNLGESLTKEYKALQAAGIIK
ncbi:hypothetical protein HZR02_17615 [Elizabethkingia anophelis]|uniref:hypothetical protein n=2 Tax=Elizabethkingia anophelis TaxID=1117645 RepID=UPI0021A8FE05|nr:hypothetical protein [Elizabethkingia anophelis]MCT3653598.1 hypothetical protein [Elizabethkingia anophelis]MCT3660704.1 hypothetical protein [Elizabethkingia anophelis]MCT3667870.1 hypothetical protein [Elizabethkingia anophelis]MCT3678620.1 hypothetical protein [Elizabethkingia anophelis]